MPAVHAEDNQNATAGDVAELKALVVQMQQQIADMQKVHTEQIEAMKAEIKKLKQGTPATDGPAAEDEAAALRALAESMVDTPEKTEKPAEEKVFKARGLSLQQLNPQISAAADFIASYRDLDDEREHGLVEIRGLELNFQGYLDPFSQMKATMHVSEEGVDLEEAYFTRYSVFKNTNLDVGKFRQQFGMINRWHEDALDQVQYPLALRNIFGDEGLAQTGISLDWTMPPLGNAYQGLTLQLTGSENERLFSGDTWGNPSFLVHYKNFRDLSPNTYLEFGLSGLLGWNDEWDCLGFADDAFILGKRHETLPTAVYGADLSVVWEPLDRALYRNLEWRSEIYLLDRDILAPNRSGHDDLQAWGAYSYLQGKVSRKVHVGLRADYFQPDSKRYANVLGYSLEPLAYNSDSPYRWQVCPYLTWWQSEFVRTRFEYDYAWGNGMEDSEHVFWLQVNFAIGPHKHERY